MKSPPTIFMSDCADISAAVAAMKAGAIEFLTKPVITSSVLSAVSMALAEDRRLRHQSASMLNLTRRLSVLTPREREVLPLVVTGYRNKQSASALGITEITLQIHRRQIMRKMAANSFADLVRMASKLQIPIAQLEQI
jgi:FixJ family two-component response regulator